MQFIKQYLNISISKKLFAVFFIIASTIFYFPIHALAESKHFSAEELALTPQFEIDSGKIRINWQEKKYTYLDFYFYQTTNQAPKNLAAITPIYSYYLYSEEATNEDEIIINYAYNPLSPPIFPYYWSEKNKNWLIPEIVSQKSGLISFKLTGKANDFFMAELKSISSQEMQVIGPADILTLNLPPLLLNKGIITTIEPLNKGVNFSKKQIGYAYNISLAAPENKSLEKIMEEAKSTYVCQDLLMSHMASNIKNNYDDVKKLQRFLLDEAGFFNIAVNGKYDKITYEAVKEFQEQNADEILKPWGLHEGTGQVYKTTAKKINSLNCELIIAKAGKMKINSKYFSLTGLAKNWRYFNEQTNNWEVLDTFDNHAKQEAAAFFTPKSITIGLFEETDQWVGEASWYAYKNGLFAASRDFPKGTKLKVTNQSDSNNRGKSVIITVNDCGPEAWTNRIIDLDKIAYQQIGNLGGGVMPVKIEIVK